MTHPCTPRQPHIPIRHERWLSAVATLLFVGLGASSLNAMEPWYVGLSIGIEQVEVDYSKSLGLVAGPDTENRASLQASHDSTRERFGVLRMVAGYRAFPAERVYLASELEVALYPKGTVTGYLPGTGSGDRDVWPGAWSLAKDYGIGGNVRFGYIPDGLGFLGPGRSLYMTAGIHWVDAEVNAAHDRCGGAENCPNPLTGNFRDGSIDAAWRAGMGIEFGGERHRFDLRIHHAVYEKTLRRRQGGLTFATPNLGYDFEVKEWSMTLGYVLGFSL